jgi:hypothetical protein
MKILAKRFLYILAWQAGLLAMVCVLILHGMILIRLAVTVADTFVDVWYLVKLAAAY